MNDIEKCPLCRGISKSGKCLSCGYIIPDSAELEYMTKLASAEPEDYPEEEAARNLFEADVNVKVCHNDVPDICDKEQTDPYLKRKTEYRTKPKSTYVHPDRKPLFREKLDMLLESNRFIFYGAYILSMLLPLRIYVIFIHIIMLLWAAIFRDKADFMSENKMWLMYAGAVMAIVLKLSVM